MATLSLLALEQPVGGTQDIAKPEYESRKADLGQFMTPPEIASFMADQFELQNPADIVLLDPGAGQGSLSKAFAARWKKSAAPNATLTIHAYELDPGMIAVLEPTLLALQDNESIFANTFAGDFIENAAAQIRSGERRYTHAILNPPYKKIGSDSSARRILSSVGIETVNLYSGFVALALEMLDQDGELVAIIPRSFCNGPYYKPFRQYILDRAAIKSIHLFEARDQAFSDDDVLQENVIIRLKRGAPQGEVVISKSTDASFRDFKAVSVGFDRIVLSGDKERFIRIPSSSADRSLNEISSYSSTLQEVGVAVSTGPIVDFRMMPHLKMEPVEGSAPLLYPGHFVEGKLVWPKRGFKKPNAIANNEETKRWLFPRGFYVVIKRFSSKEEKRRIVASLVNPSDLPDSPIGFENHFNVIHVDKGPLSEELARGLVAYLNAKIVDDWFRQFNGHTQVNATDLRSLPFPSHDNLVALGKWTKLNPNLSQSEIDEKVGDAE